MYIHQSGPARSTRQESAIPSVQKTNAASSSCHENGYWPEPGKARQSATSTTPKAATVSAGASKVRRSSQRAMPKPASSSASSRKASGLAARVSAARTAKRHERRACSAQIESSASAAPSANGNAAENTIPAQTTANVRLDQRAVGPHCRETITANASAAVETVATASSRIPNSAASG